VYTYTHIHNVMLEIICLHRKIIDHVTRD